MADIQVSVSVEPEVQSLCDGLVKECQDLKSKQPTATLLGDAMPILLAVAGSYQALSADVKSAEALAYLGLSLGKVAAIFLGDV